MHRLIGLPEKEALSELGFKNYKVEWSEPDEWPIPRGFVFVKDARATETGIEACLSGPQDQPVLFSIAINLENFTGPLPLGLTRGDNETDIIKNLGTPDARGGGTSHPILGTIHPWVRFESKDEHSATLELIDDRLSKISIFDPKVML